MLMNSTAKTDAAPPKTWRDGGNRAERAQLLRDALFSAASEIVGEVGYQEASISLITQRAGVAQGTFYNHFKSRQDILDQLLPALGRQLLEHVRTSARGGRNLAEKEELSFKAFFTFLSTTPHFFRILNEAESFAPEAYKTHMELVTNSYVKFLTHAREHGELQGYEARELEVVAVVLVAARSYLAWRFARGESGAPNIPPWVVKAYLKFAMNGLHGKQVVKKDPVAAKKAVSRASK